MLPVGFVGVGTGENLSLFFLLQEASKERKGAFRFLTRSRERRAGCSVGWLGLGLVGLYYYSYDDIISRGTFDQ